MSSVRVSSSPASRHAVGDPSNAEADGDDDGEQDGGSAKGVRVDTHPARPCYPLFVDGIADSVSYFQVRDLFLQHGKLTNVFLQRKRNNGRKFRFGFVRYTNKEDAVSAMESLNGVRLGGAYLSVKPEISAGKMKGRPRQRCSVPVTTMVTVKGSHSQGRQGGFSSSSRSDVVKGFSVTMAGKLPQLDSEVQGGFSSSGRAWSDVVKGFYVARAGKQALLDSEVMLLGVGCCVSCSNRFNDELLFPELVAAGRIGDEGEQRVSDLVLFPEAAAWRSLVSWKAPEVCVAGSFEGGRSVAAVFGGLDSRTDLDAVVAGPDEGGRSLVAVSDGMDSWSTLDARAIGTVEFEKSMPGVNEKEQTGEYSEVLLAAGDSVFVPPFMAIKDNFIVFSGLVPPRSEFRNGLDPLVSGLLKFKFFITPPLGSRRNSWHWLNDFCEYLSFPSPAAPVGGDLSSLLASSTQAFGHGFLDAREVVGDSAYDVGVLTCVGVTPGRPAHSCFEVGACSNLGSVRLEVCNDFEKVEVSPRADSDVDAYDPILALSPPRTRPRGRPKRMIEAKRGLKDSRRPRGRPRKSECLVFNAASRSPSPPTPSGPYFTRATKAWYLAKSVGMVFPGSDDEAIRGLAEELRENWPVSL